MTSNKKQSNVRSWMQSRIFHLQSKSRSLPQCSVSYQCQYQVSTQGHIFPTLNLQFLLIKAPLHSNPVFFIVINSSRIKDSQMLIKNSQIFSTACNISFPITSNHGTFCSDLKESFQKNPPQKFVQDILFYIKSESQNNAPHLMFTQWCM